MILKFCALLFFKLGRIPLHYVRATTQPDLIRQILVAAGSEVDVEDNNGRTPSYYLDTDTEIHLPDRIRYERLYNEGNFAFAPICPISWPHLARAFWPFTSSSQYTSNKARYFFDFL